MTKTLETDLREKLLELRSYWQGNALALAMFAHSAKRPTKEHYCMGRQDGMNACIEDITTLLQKHTPKRTTKGRK